MAAEEGNSKTGSILEGDQDKGVPSWLVPILSGLGSMGGSYMLWVKPLQENFKVMAEQIEDLKDEMREIKQKQKEVDRNFHGKLEEALKGIETSKRFDGKEKDEDDEDELILSTKKGKHIRQTKTKKRITVLK